MEVETNVCFDVQTCVFKTRGNRANHLHAIYCYYSCLWFYAPTNEWMGQYKSQWPQPQEIVEIRKLYTGLEISTFEVQLYLFQTINFLY